MIDPQRARVVCRRVDAVVLGSRSSRRVGLLALGWTTMIERRTLVLRGVLDVCFLSVMNERPDYGHHGVGDPDPRSHTDVALDDRLEGAAVGPRLDRSTDGGRG